MTQKYNNQIYNLYEKEVERNNKLSLKYKKLRWEVEDLRYENKQLNDKLDNMDLIIKNTVNKEVEKATKPLIEEIKNLKDKLKSVNNEIDRLKCEIKGKDKTIDNLNNTINSQGYNIDKLEGKVNKNSTNSSIPTSKEIVLALIHIITEKNLQKRKVQNLDIGVLIYQKKKSRKK